MTGIMEFVREHFWHVAPILLSGAFAAAIMVERFQALFVKYPIHNTQDFFDKLTDLVLRGKVPDAVAPCDRSQSKPAARVVKQALLRAHQPESLIEHGLQIAVGDATKGVQKRTVFL